MAHYVMSVIPIMPSAISTSMREMKLAGLV